jgi:hypothetical protein
VKRVAGRCPWSRSSSRDRAARISFLWISRVPRRASIFTPRVRVCATGQVLHSPEAAPSADSRFSPCARACLSRISPAGAVVRARFSPDFSCWDSRCLAPLPPGFGFHQSIPFLLRLAQLPPVASSLERAPPVPPPQLPEVLVSPRPVFFSSSGLILSTDKNSFLRAQWPA